MNLNNNEGYINMESFENFWTTSIPQYHFQIRIEYVTHILMVETWYTQFTQRKRSNSVRIEVLINSW